MTSGVKALALLAAIPALLSTPSVHAAEATHPAPNAGDAESATTKQLPGGAVLHLAPGTRIEVVRTLKLQLGPPGSAETVTQVVKVVSGRVDVEIPISRVPKTAVLFQAPHKAS